MWNGNAQIVGSLSSKRGKFLSKDKSLSKEKSLSNEKSLSAE